MTETSKEKSAWIDAVWNVISENLSRTKSFNEPVQLIALINFDTIRIMADFLKLHNTFYNQKYVL